MECSSTLPSVRSGAKGVLYGLINTILVIPVSCAFTSIIFSDTTFDAYIPLLTKLVLFSSAVHQLQYTLFSSLPFAVGQVQDAGLIFLASMAGNIVESMTQQGLSDAAILATCLVVLSTCTWALGLMLILLGQLRMAGLVQYLPLSVVGGYLAFIGYFCGNAGLTMMAGVDSSAALLSGKSFALFMPGVILGVGMYLALRNIRSAFVLPAFMTATVLGFYAILFIGGFTLQDARDAGWVAPVAPMASVFDSWALYDLSLVQWGQLPRQFVRWLGMFLVVAFSSSLDVAAIEMELGLPLDYNRELRTVGISNAVSGLTGGFTGSYIFSQTIFTMRRGISSRVCGYIIATLQFALSVLPVDITSLLPRAFFGALLILISVDLLVEWLILARQKMMAIEYAVCLLTFVAILFTGIEVGLGIGVLFAIIAFAVSYAKLASVVKTQLKSSTVVRTFEERAVLIANRNKIVTLSLSGYIFFGSAVKILEELKSHVVINASTEEGIKAWERERNQEDAETPSAASLLTAFLTPAQAVPTRRRSFVGGGPSNPDDLGDGDGDSPSSKSRSLLHGDLERRALRLSGISYGAVPSSDEGISGLPTDTFASRRSFDNIITSGDGASGSDAGSPAASSLTNAPLLSVYEMNGAAITRHSELWRQVSHPPTGTSPPPLLQGQPHYYQASAAAAAATDTVALQQQQTLGSVSLLATVWNSQASFREQKKAQRRSSSSHRPDATFNACTSTSMAAPFDIEATAIEMKPYQNQESHQDSISSQSLSALSPSSLPSPLSIPAISSHFPQQPAASNPTATSKPYLYSPSKGRAVDDRYSTVTEYLVLDFANVLGIDATAARSCFLMLVQLMRAAGVTVVFGAVDAPIETLLRAHGVIRQDDVVIPKIDDALEWAEEEILYRAQKSSLGSKIAPDAAISQRRAGGLLRDPSYYAEASNRRRRESKVKHAGHSGADLPIRCGSADELALLSDGSPGRSQVAGSTKTAEAAILSKQARALRRILEDYLEVTRSDKESIPDFSTFLSTSYLIRYFERIVVPEGELIFDMNMPAERIFFVEEGEVELVGGLTVDETDCETGHASRSGARASGVVSAERLNKICSGGIFGEAAFFLGAPHSARALALSESVLWTLSRDSLANMEVDQPRLCLLMQHLLLKSLSIASASTQASYTSIFE